MLERVGRQPAGPAQLAQHVGVDDPELEAETVGHLGFPLERERRRADDEHGAGAVAEQQFLR